MSHYGDKFFRIHDDQTDRIGIRTLVLAQLWQATRARMTLDELDAEAPATPATPSGMELIGRQRRPVGGALKEFWTYTGVHGNGKDVTFKTYGNSPDYQFDPGFSQVSILKHPNIRELMDRFGGQVVDTEIVWPPLIEGGVDFASAGSNGLGVFSGAGTATVTALGLAGGNGSGAGQTNPMFGEQDFFRTEGTYTYRYAAANLSGLRAGVRIVSAAGLPGEAPGYEGRDYLVGPSPYRRHGPVYAITLVAWLSGAGGWNKYIYGGGAAS